MKRFLLSATLVALMFAGCLDDSSSRSDDDQGGDDAVPTGPVGSAEFTDMGSLTVGTENPSTDPPTCGEAPGGMATHTWDIPADVNGTAVEATAITVTLGFDGMRADVDLYLFGPDGTLLGSGTVFNPTDAPEGETVSISGTYPPGGYTIEVRMCTGAAIDYSVDASADLVAVSEDRSGIDGGPAA